MLLLLLLLLRRRRPLYVRQTKCRQEANRTSIDVCVSVCVVYSNLSRDQRISSLFVCFNPIHHLTAG